ncbi:MAG: hypothetical protein KME43_22725 [Myxacorys chilensis ATA2-1-KO14]|jgi:NADP-dependent 3-hydroxy acid dehydrogenase YdfG|nr:hypothetical protein [Myxacorys chilensis ATA2-1-KO14]
MSNNTEGKAVIMDAIVVLSRQRGDRLQSLADELNSSDGKALAVTTDITHCEHADLDI